MLREHIDQLLPHADQILIMDAGKITVSGSYNEILSKEPNIVSEAQKETSDLPLVTIERSNSRLTIVEKKVHTDISVQTVDDKKTIRVKHQGNWPVYKYYFRSAGYGLLVSFLAFTVIEAFCTSFQGLLRLIPIDQKES